MEQRITAITLGVSDIGRTRSFYEGLGWEGESPDGEVVFFQAGGMVLALWGRDLLSEDSGVLDGGGWGGVTLAYNVRSPEEVDSVIAAASAAGALVGRAPATTFWGGYSGCSSTRTATRGKWRTTPAGRSPRMGPSHCISRVLFST